MIRTLLIFLFTGVLASAAPAQEQPTAAPAREYWMGAMTTGAPANPSMEFLITLWQDGQAWRGTLDIPPSVGIGGAFGVEFLHVDHGAELIEMVQAGQAGGQANVFIMHRTPPGSDTAEGRVLVSGSVEISARMWKVTTEVAADFMPRRPQLPKPPLPYEMRPVQVPNTRAGQTVEVAGVLTVPPGPGPFPAVVLVNAFDTHDVDHSSMGHKPFVVLADRLARAGIASLRTQDRPLAKPSLAPHTQLTIEQLGEEAAQRVVWLAGQPGIDAKRIGLIGLNEGATAAAIAAAQAGDLARCIVMLAPLGVTGLQQLRDEFAAAMRREGEKPEFVDQRTASFIHQYELLAQGAAEARIVDAIDAEMTMQRAARRQQLGEASAEIISGMARQQFLIINTEEFRRGLVFDPAPVFSRLKIPAMAILGEKDPRFTPSTNLPAIQASLGSRPGVESVIKVAPGLNHRLQPAHSGSMAEIQQIETTFDDRMLGDVIEFLSRQLAAAAASKEGSK